jgi:threonylcarbamoyladenosine tRNA methylthiotransferase MtaB
VKYSILTFGCRVNQADSFHLECDLQARGGVPAPPETADVVVVNSCSVTASAESGARYAIRRLARTNPGARIIATGCYATRQPADLASLPGVVCVLPNGRKAGVAATLSAEAARATAGPAGEPAPDAVADVVDPEVLRPGARGRTAFPLRVQTGCDERCSYCVIPETRGAGTSQPLEGVVREARLAAAAGFKEIWLTGVHLGSYGRDLSPARSLIDLMGALAERTADVTYRLSSLEPMDCTPEIVETVARPGPWMPHLHLPLQHGSNRMLRAMRRPYTAGHFEQIVRHVRRLLPDAAIGTDVITGFPGETPEDVEELAAFLDASPVTHVHVFPYSDRPGTDARRMAPKVGGDVARCRAERLRDIGRELNRRFVRRQVGAIRPALTLGDGTLALTDNYLKVRIPGGRARNERVRVRIESAEPLCGEVEP